MIQSWTVGWSYDMSLSQMMACSWHAARYKLELSHQKSAATISAGQQLQPLTFSTMPIYWLPLTITMVTTFQQQLVTIIDHTSHCVLEFDYAKLSLRPFYWYVCFVDFPQTLFSLFIQASLRQPACHTRQLMQPSQNSPISGPMLFMHTGPATDQETMLYWGGHLDATFWIIRRWVHWQVCQKQMQLSRSDSISLKMDSSYTMLPSTLRENILQGGSFIKEISSER